jgi:SAM-dependent methyltransferase
MDDRAHRNFWDREVINPSHVTWMEPVVIRHYINESISGHYGTWPIEWFERQFAPELPFDRALIIGCGGGALDRQLLKRGVCKAIDAFDASFASVLLAQQTQRAEGLNSIRYFVGDFNFPALPRRKYDIVFFHHSLHHVTYLERLFRSLLGTLKPGGLLYLDEYVGPSRTEWSEHLIETHRGVFNALPASARQDRPLEVPIQHDDPSEAVRSSEIVDTLKVGFRILFKRDYGGNLLSVLYPFLRQPCSDDVLRDLIEQEGSHLREHGNCSYHSVIVAKRRRFAAAVIAYARYRVRGALRREKLAKLLRGSG